MKTDSRRDTRFWALVALAGGVLLVASVFLVWYQTGRVDGGARTGLEFGRWGLASLLIGVCMIAAAAVAAFARSRATAVWLFLIVFGVLGSASLIWVSINVSEAVTWFPATDGHVEVLGSYFDLHHIGVGLLAAIAGALIATAGAAGGYRQSRAATSPTT